MQISDRIGRRMKLHDLHVLMGVVQAGSMGKAASLLNTTQSAISRSITELEHAVGVRLLDRSRQGVEPTEYGRALLDGGAAVFDDLRQAVKKIEFLADPTVGHVTVGGNEAKAEPLSQSTEAGPVGGAEAGATQAVAGAASTGGSPSNGQPADAKITIDDFVKVELRVGLVKVAERVPKSDKLLRLEVDIGSEVRQVLAGIAEAYAPETLVGRKVVIVANLAPRKMRGLESNGMIVAASLEGGKPVLAAFLEDVPVGARLK